MSRAFPTPVEPASSHWDSEPDSLSSAHCCSANPAVGRRGYRSESTRSGSGDADQLNRELPSGRSCSNPGRIKKLPVAVSRT